MRREKLAEREKKRGRTLLLGGIFFIAVFIAVPLAVVWRGAINAPTLASAELSSQPATPLQSIDMSCSEEPSNPVTCFEGESSLECGQRALEAGDWNQALLVFAEMEDACDAYFGRFLALVMDLYHFHNNVELYFDDSHGPIQNAGEATELETHAAYLAEAIESDKDIRTNLALIQKHECEFKKASGEGDLRVQYNIGPCWGRLAEGFLVGDWDDADAFFIYSNLVPPNPPLNRRSVLILKECDPKQCLCQAQNPLGIPAPPCDAQEYGTQLGEAMLSFGEREPGAANHVFRWNDENDSGDLDGSDTFDIRYLDATTAESIFVSGGITIRPSWTPMDYPAPESIPSFQVCTYCPEGETCYGAPACDPNNPDTCTPGPDDCIDESTPPIFIQTQDTGVRVSPDGSKIVRMLPVETTVNGETLLVAKQVFIYDADDPCVLDDNVNTSTDGSCGQCLTCDTFGLKDGGWFIRDPDNPTGPAIGILYGGNQNYPTSSGTLGGGLGAELYAMTPDGTVKNRLTTTSVFTQNYQYKPSPDGKAVGWTTTWDLDSGKPGPTRLVLADLVHNPGGDPVFSLENIRYPLPGKDTGWHEFGNFHPSWPNPQQITFTSTGPSANNPDSFLMDTDTGDIFRMSPEDPWWDEVQQLESNGIHFVKWGTGTRTWDQHLWNLPGRTNLFGASLFGLWTAPGLIAVGFGSFAQSGFQANLMWTIGTLGTDEIPGPYDQAAFDAGWRTSAITAQAPRIGNRHYIWETKGQTTRFRYLEFGSSE
jgi:hypothetical protein